jgi:hypothetical protein
MMYEKKPFRQKAFEWWKVWAQLLHNCRKFMNSESTKAIEFKNYNVELYLWTYNHKPFSPGRKFNWEVNWPKRGQSLASLQHSVSSFGPFPLSFHFGPPVIHSFITMDKYIQATALQALAGVGFLFLSAKLFSFLRLLASSFILPGTSVRRSIGYSIQSSQC